MADYKAILISYRIWNNAKETDKNSHRNKINKIWMEANSPLVMKLKIY
jgi:hypothetical protein